MGGSSVSSVFHVEHFGGLFPGEILQGPWDRPGPTGPGLLPDETGRDTNLFHVEHSRIPGAGSASIAVG